MLELMRMLFGAVFSIFDYSIKIDTYVIKLWHFPAFGLIMGLALKFIFGGGSIKNE